LDVETEEEPEVYSGTLAVFNKVPVPRSHLKFDSG